MSGISPIRSETADPGAGSIWRLDVTGFVLAVVSAIVLIAAAEALTDRKSRHTA